MHLVLGSSLNFCFVSLFFASLEAFLSISTNIHPACLCCRGSERMDAVAPDLGRLGPAGVASPSQSCHKVADSLRHSHLPVSSMCTSLKEHSNPGTPGAFGGVRWHPPPRQTWWFHRREVKLHDWMTCSWNNLTLILCQQFKWGPHPPQPPPLSITYD